MYKSYQYRLDNNSSWSEFLNARKSEFQESCLASILTTNEFTEAPNIFSDCFELSDSLVIGARVKLLQNELPSISCNIGTLLCIDDLILSSFCNPNFFSNSLIEGEAKDKLLFREIKNGNIEDRFLDYSKLEQQASDSKITLLTHQIPLSKWRLSQASLLAGIATEWILLHETSHWLMGHSHIAKDQRIDESLHHLIDFTILESKSNLSNDEKKCMELQADGTAFELLFHSLLCKEIPSQNWSDYCIEQEGIKNSLKLNTPEERIRALLVSSGCIVLLFERMRSNSKLSDSESYPPPLTRLQNLFATALRQICVYTNVLAENEAGALVISAEKFKQSETQFKQLMSGVTSAMSDLAILTNLLNIEDSMMDKIDSNFTEVWENLSQSEVFLPDLISLVTGPSISNDMEGEKKSAMIEYIRLLSFQDMLNQKLENFSLIEL